MEALEILRKLPILIATLQKLFLYINIYTYMFLIFKNALDNWNWVEDNFIQKNQILDHETVFNLQDFGNYLN